MTPREFESWLDQPTKRRPLVMGILNVTPDSFSDGGQFLDAARAVAHARRMTDEGADLIDIGAESTRPGAQPVEAAEQLRRALPVIQSIRGAGNPIALSIDTRSAEVAGEAIKAGASIINDVSAGRHDVRMFQLAADCGASLILMHMRGDPQTMQDAPQYQEVSAEVARFLSDRMSAAIDAGVHLKRLLLDPGIGFGKTDEHDLELLREIDRIAAIGPPLVVGVSRKRIVGSVTGRPKEERIHGTAAAVAWVISRGAQIVRVHDVAAMRDVLKMIWAIMRNET